MGLWPVNLIVTTLRSFWWNESKDIMTRTNMHISNVKLPFYPPCEVKCGLQIRCQQLYPLVHRSCDHFVMTYIVFISHLYIWWCMLFLTYLSMCCFISLFIHTFLYVYNPLFLFHTKMSWWVLFKVFQKDRLSKSIMSWTLFLQSFSRVCDRIRFYCIQQVIMTLVI